MPARLSVNINDETRQDLVDLASKYGASVTEIVRRSVAIYDFLSDQVFHKSKELQLVDEEGCKTQVMFVC